MKKYLAIVLTLVLTIALFAACIGFFVPAAQARQFITIASAQLGGATHNSAMAIAAAANISIVGYRVEAVPTAGQTESARMQRAGEVEINTMGVDAVFNARNGLDIFEGNPWPELRILFPQFPTFANICVPANSSVQTFDDLRGQRVGMGNPGSAAFFVINHLLRAHGIENDVTQAPLDPSEQIVALNDGHIDVFAFFTTPNSPFIMELDATMPIRWINVDRAKWEAYAKETRLPFVVTTVPAGYYTGMTEPIDKLSGMNLFVSRADVPEETIYQFTRHFFENFQTAVSAVSAIEVIPDLLATHVPHAPWHPGVVRFFREANIPFIEYQGQN